jgi:hypothetical protein
MMVAVGVSYRIAPLRILVLGESHYLDSAEASNHPDFWYERRDLANTLSAANINTRNVVDNAINARKPRKSKAIFHSLTSALNACGIAAAGARSSLKSIAYMNYFQRPAEESGESIRVHPRDVVEAASVVAEVVTVLQPQLVVFASRLAWRHAKAGLAEQLKLIGIQTLDVPHPATSWWNRPSRPMKGRTGRQRFIDTVLAAGSGGHVPYTDAVIGPAD